MPDRLDHPLPAAILCKGMLYKCQARLDWRGRGPCRVPNGPAARFFAHIRYFIGEFGNYSGPYVSHLSLRPNCTKINDLPDGHTCPHHLSQRDTPVPSWDTPVPPKFVMKSR